MSTRTTAPGELPSQPQPGDRVRLKSDRVDAYTEACRLAGWDDFNAFATYEVQRVDPHCPAGGTRLFIDKPPHVLGSRDVSLVWNSDDDRRKALRLKGWKG